MKYIKTFALATMLSVSFIGGARAEHMGWGTPPVVTEEQPVQTVTKKVSRNNKISVEVNRHSGSGGFVHAYAKVRSNCFTPELRTKLNSLSAHFGKPITLISGADSRHSSGSYHYRCMAADIRVNGVSNGTLASVAKNYFNGVGLYSGRKGHVHVDVRSVRYHWHH